MKRLKKITTDSLVLHLRTTSLNRLLSSVIVTRYPNTDDLLSTPIIFDRNAENAIVPFKKKSGILGPSDQLYRRLRLFGKVKLESQ